MGRHLAVTNAAGEKVSNWNRADYLLVACAMIPFIEKGKKRRDAMAIAQRLLPPNKHRPENKLARNLVSELFVECMKEAQAMTPEARTALIAKMPDELVAKMRPTSDTPVKEPLEYAKRRYGPNSERVTDRGAPREMRVTSDGKTRPAHTIKHRDSELALIARRIAYFQIDMKDTRPLSRLYKVAQAIELPPERHRSSGSIDAGMKLIRENLVRVHADPVLRAALPPFDAARRTYIPADGVDIDAVHTQAEPADPIDAQAAADAAMPQSKMRPQEAPAPIPAPTPAPAFQSPPSDAIRRFGEVFSQGMHDLVSSMAVEMMANLEMRMSAMAERLMSRTVETLAQGIGPLVHSALESELGGKVAAPTAAPAMVLPPGASLPKGLQLDVVGLIGSQVTEVREKLNGYAAGIRFINADDVGGWTPRGTVVLNTKFISHNAEDKCRKAGVRPIRVQGGAGAILNAIRTLFENEGIALPHAH